VNLELGFRHTAQRDLRIGPFLALLSAGPPAGAADRRDDEV